MILDILTKNTNVMRKLVMLLLGVLMFCEGVLAQNRTISGKVVDENGAPLPNASIVVKGSQSGTTSGPDGSFQLSVPASARQLEVTSVGYALNSITLESGKSSYTIVMVTGNSTLEDVVITGYTTISRKKSSNATVNVNAEAVRQQPFGSFDQALQGAGSGVSVVANSGQPGANAIVRVRGTGSISGGNAPLYILDGIEITGADFASLNQGDFDKVEILKDATGTALYGSRGANGVIVISTKKGVAGKMQFNYDGQVGFSRLPEDRLVVMNSRQKIDYELQRGNPYGWSPAEADSLRNVNFSWRDALFQQGVTQQHQISASGGNAASRFFASLSYMDQEGIVRTTGLQRYTGRINVDNTIKNFKFGVNLTGGYSRIQGTGEGNTFLSSPLNAIRWSNPYERDRDPNSGEFQETGGAGTGQLGSGQPNGAMELFLNNNYSLQTKAVGVSYLEYNAPFLKGLKFRTNWGIDYVNNEGFNFTSPRTSVGIARQGILSRSMSRNLRYTGTTSINYRKEFGLHEIDGGVFFEVVKNNARNFGFTGYGFTNGFTNEAGITPGSAANENFIPAVAGGGGQNGIQSYFATANYGYNSKYYLTGVIRRDGSSRFGENNRFATFGSVGVTWVVIDEDFMKDQRVFDDLRFRASFGTNGNNSTPTGNFGQIPQFGRTSYAGVSGWIIGAPGNLNYKWETNQTTNIGLDFTVLKNKVSGTIELYDRRSLNQFYDENVSLALGIPGNSVPGNVGEVQNRGIEFDLKYNIINKRDFKLSVGGNITYNDNKVVELIGGRDSITAGNYILAKGFPVYSNYLVEYGGVNSANGNALYYTSGKDGPKRLTQTFSANDRQIFGTNQSPLFGGLNLFAEYKGLSFSMQWNYFLDRLVYNNDMNNVTNPTYFFDNMHVDLLTEWRQPGDVTNVPRPSSANGNAFRAETTRFLEDGSFWRLRNVTLAYNMPAKALGKSGIKSARIFVQGQNLFTATVFRGFDPEIAGAAGSGLVGAQYPALVQTTVGLSVGF